MIKGRDASREIAVFTSREKTRLARAIWCIGSRLELAAGTSHVGWIIGALLYVSVMLDARTRNVEAALPSLHF